MYPRAAEFLCVFMRWPPPPLSPPSPPPPPPLMACPDALQSYKKRSIIHRESIQTHLLFTSTGLWCVSQSELPLENFLSKRHRSSKSSSTGSFLRTFIRLQLRVSLGLNVDKNERWKPAAACCEYSDHRQCLCVFFTQTPWWRFNQNSVPKSNSSV